MFSTRWKIYSSSRVEKINFLPRSNNNVGQSVIEYFVVTAVILAVILSSGVIERMRERFGDYFNAAVAHMR